MKMKAATLILAGLALAGCSDSLKQQVGLGKRSPDEFKVVTRAPLSLPPDFNLRPPRPGAARPQEGTPQSRARRAVFNIDGSVQTANEQSTLDKKGLSASETAFLKRAGAEGSPEDIRLLVDRETRSFNKASEQLTDALIFWRDAQPPGTVVDPTAESRRLQENAALGTRGAGDTPTIDREAKAPLEDLF
ncbi:DUF3035 domain-containing protein [Kiloniella sp. b19]|uniref:DUF3035 domain-containing protein n=1 Tax=Kiloniella sp. GXU_MW_B19 TaxID=3141326 RepID=UPI0031DBA001